VKDLRLWLIAAALAFATSIGLYLIPEIACVGLVVHVLVPRARATCSSTILLAFEDHVRTQFAPYEVKSN
jgi:uncharacterized membrane protein